MTSTARKRSAIRPWHVIVLALVVVAVVAAFNVKVVSASQAKADSGSSFDPAAFAKKSYSKDVAPYVAKNAVPLAQLLTALGNGAEQAKYGHSSGEASAYSFPVSFEGTAGTPAQGLLPVTVEGVPAGTTVQVQVGPALNGTALRDVTGKISFQQFTNQLQYQQVGTELNNQVKADVLKNIDQATLAGKKIEVLGAFTRVNPNLVSVVPTKLVVAP